MANTITLNKDYGYTSYKAPSGLAADTIIDASAASWIVANSHNSNPTSSNPATAGSLPINLYPFQVTGAGDGLVVRGGTIHGEVPQNSDWQYTYVNSAAVRVNSANSFVIDDWTITNPWDGIRVGGTGTFRIEDTYVANSRDDAVENDDVIGGTITDSLFDNVFSGISLGDGDVDGSHNVVTMDGMLLRSKSYFYKGEMTHGSPFKLDKGTGDADVVPSLRFINDVVAIEDVHHFGQERLQRAWDKTIESHGNVFLNLSDTPLPSDYPKPGAGWTILQGQAARDYWAKARAAWIDDHKGALTPTDPSTPTDPTPSLNKIEGNSSSNTLKGTSGADDIYGHGGNDKIYGKNGSDVLTGGSGKDTFVFDTKPGANNVDTITDFNVSDDRIWLDNAVYTKLGSGSTSSPRTLSKSYFEIGSKADDSNDYILYDKATGSLYYDADGSGKGAAVEIAKLAKGLSLTYNDFYVV
ncbi:calcium-binding protein [Microvirga terricola]|uniref:Calcium-binding protein n=1 Tax=Microvirga terricola TaxID=2719797 RepID=A0ABX0VAK7_9HYPH|nr:calcium-binding protein [Microvirga terricola]NIX76883.1 calcium-binding protein [Microvirga terricola]